MNPLPFLNLRYVLLIAVFLAGYKVADWRFSARELEQENQRIEQAEKALNEAIEAYNHVAGQLVKANDANTKKLKDAQNETNLLRDRLNAGAIGLRIAGSCPRVSAIAESPAGPGMDHGAGAELDATARQAYFALRDGIDRASAQLAACQDELRIRIEGGSK